MRGCSPDHDWLQLERRAQLVRGGKPHGCNPHTFMQCIHACVPACGMPAALTLVPVMEVVLASVSPRPKGARKAAAMARVHARVWTGTRKERGGAPQEGQGNGFVGCRGSVGWR
mgnify:CR=1 FL=1